MRAVLLLFDGQLRRFLNGNGEEARDSINMPDDPDKNLLSNAYEDGKHRRYELLFAVNGGAFAVAKLFPEQKTGCFLGNLTLHEVAWGLIFFTIVMGIDIFVFGYQMRTRAGIPNFLFKFWDKNTWSRTFNWFGRFVLILICLLIVSGWWRVTSGPLPHSACIP